MTTTTLWRHGGFLRLWGGETTSQLGAQLGGIAIPVLAVVVLHASEFEVGVLGAAGTAAFLVVGLPAGALIDRMLKRRVMLRADLVRAIAMGAIPLLWFLGVLEMWHLIVLATIVGIARVFFDVAYQSYVPILVERSQVSDANSKLETTAQIAGIGGPALGGALLTIIQAPLILLTTAVTYIVSFVMLSTIRDSEVRAPRESRRPLWIEIREGAAFVWNQPLLRPIVAATATTNFFSTLALTLLPILVLRELGLSPAALGVAVGVGAVGGLVGAAASARLTKWIGEGTIIVWSSIGCGIAGLIFATMTLVPEPLIVPVFIAAEFLLSFGVLVYNIAQVSFRQRICPTPLLGRMNASIRFVVWGIMPIAGLASGIAATAFGVIPVVWFGMIGGLLASGFVIFSPLRGMRTLPDSVVAD
jgi:MFS family permease